MPGTKKKAISVASRKDKGRRLQKDLARRISDLLGLPWGKDELIAPRPMGQGGPDIVLKGEAFERFPWCFECKWQEIWSVPDWVRQVLATLQKEREEGRDFQAWALVMRRSRKGPRSQRLSDLVVMDIDTFFALFKELHRFYRTHEQWVKDKDTC